MNDTILDTIKNMLGIELSDSHFNSELLVYINGTIPSLSEIGIGPEDGLLVDENTMWSELYDNKLCNNVKTYIYMKVKMIFDPPLSSIANEAIKQEINQIEWRLNHEAEKG